MYRVWSSDIYTMYMFIYAGTTANISTQPQWTPCTRPLALAVQYHTTYADIFDFLRGTAYDWNMGFPAAAPRSNGIVAHCTMQGTTWALCLFSHIEMRRVDNSSLAIGNCLTSPPLRLGMLYAATCSRALHDTMLASVRIGKRAQRICAAILSNEAPVQKQGQNSPKYPGTLHIRS